jgi:hypothetical protein
MAQSDPRRKIRGSRRHFRRGERKNSWRCASNAGDVVLGTSPEGKLSYVASLEEWFQNPLPDKSALTPAEILVPTTGF